MDPETVEAWFATERRPWVQTPGMAEEASALIGDEGISVRSDWRVAALQGTLSIIYGSVALLFPGLTLLVFLSLFGTFGLLFGALSIFDGWRVTRVQGGDWGVEVLEGTIFMLLSVVALSVPSATSIVVLYLVAAWAMMTGITQILMGVRLPGDDFLLVTLNGSSLVLLSGFLYLQPPAQAILAMVWCIALEAIISGTFLVLTAAKLKRLRGVRLG
mmetsp:Transcript_7144/g.14690  ORF Transcript_7144/g.14690 Transcript_7144/m.14690 type:complete len:216 (-) Transcript_7144:483-1130(-)|eukprot:CAMPEP_0184688872 /NCGR_PEP_ID=MMETSP0312-20130426/30336_1 /TAXON_ID=31354 /ORGANISM="Compsopogon coeruleus, Strain SAG 36.94" /LENGTH=215 /DNA_ID=CAMNT_0027146147 /DNA_START=116 /DNA_END=763 /DNA_ORIENTATION=-